MLGNVRAAVALVLGTSLLTMNVMAANTTFNDVPKNHWAYDYVTRASEQNLVSGVGNGKYGVDMRLSNAHFVVMICNLFYKDAVTAGQSGSDWWRPYLNAAYAKGVLLNTTVGDQRSNSKDWNSTMVNAEINRYDMAQIILNLSKNQGWESPSVVEIAAASTKIADWKSIPSKYQVAVATAYAKGFLSGMDSAGTFMGTKSMTRAQGAVVLCTLMDAKNKVDAPVYTNTTKLVNGKSATTSNVVNAVDALKVEHPQGTTWNMSRRYTSAQLGTGTGSQAFAYLLSDKVFGNMKATEQSKPSKLKAGDVVYLHSDKQYVLVLQVSGKEFSYVSCNADGLISWRGSGEIHDLGSKDTIYTRYTASVSSDGELANGDNATEKNVHSALMDVKDDYPQGDTWDMEERHRTEMFGSVYGSEAFAGVISDEVFGDLEVREHTDHDALKVGDVVYLDDDEEYVVVLDVDRDEFTYAGVSSRGKITWKGVQDIDDLGKRDTVYTRYPKSASSDGELANGKSATEKNVSSALLDVEDDYAQGDTWDMEKRYRTEVFGSVYGSEAFAGFVSDEVFGDLEVREHTDHDALKTGDIVYLDDSEEYVVVLDVDRDEFTYAGVSSRGKITWKGVQDIDDLGKRDTVYTRYPKEQKDTLANGKSVTEKNVSKALADVEKDDYAQGDTWNMEKRYRSDVLGSGYGSEAFAYYVSDEVFGELEMTKHHKASKLKVGDVIYLSEYDEYAVVVDVDDGEFMYASVKSNGKVFWNGVYDLDDLDTDDIIYTRYPD